MPLSEILILSNSQVIKALNSLNFASTKCLIVVDSDNKLLGTISDGDIRRGVLRGIGLDSHIDSVYCRTPHFVINSTHSVESVKKLMSSNKIELIPIVDSNNYVIDYYTWSNLFQKHKENKFNKFDAHVVIMAGGRGERLKPFTSILPKPLIPINDKPILIHIIDKFLQYGLVNFHITVNYKSRIIKAFFEEEDFEYNLNYIYEGKPLGTAGSLRYLLGKISEPFIVTNCDIVLEANYYKIYEYHNNNKFDITLVSSEKNHTIPYGVCELNKDGSLSNINEKPSHDYLINVGYYILNPEVLGLIPKDTVFHMTDLIELANLKKYKIGVYTVSENDWVDIGQWKEFNKALEIL
jgi:dTDP-glucose pyrophosphorylase